MITRTSFTILILLSGICSSCGKDTPATPEQQAQVIEVLDSATLYLQASKRFLRLPQATIPELDSGGDFFVVDKAEQKLVSPDILVSLQGDNAEVLFGLKGIQDSLDSERDAIVRMTRDSGIWKGKGVYIVE